MKTYTLPQAFAEVMNQKDIWRKLKLSKQTVMNRRVMIKDGTFPGDATMRRLLKKAGWKQAVVEKWKK